MSGVVECNLITIVASATWAINLELPVIKMNVAQFTYDKNNINVRWVAQYINFYH